MGDKRSVIAFFNYLLPVEESMPVTLFNPSVVTMKKLKAGVNNIETSKKWTKKKKMKNSSKDDEDIGHLTKEFVGHKLSAAGIPYVVTSKSKFRRYAWCIAVLTTMAFMGYMTANVFLEYLNYPKMVKRDVTIVTKLNFPAVTVCSLSPIPEVRVNKTSILKLLKLTNLLKETATKVPSNESASNECYRNPLCMWSWFNESCTCATSPCMTQFCTQVNGAQCTCSYVFCTDDDPAVRGKCKNSTTAATGNNNEETSKLCVCDNEQDVSKHHKSPWFSQEKPSDLQELLKHFKDQEISDVIRIIRNSQVDDLVDVEEGLMPTIEDIYHFGVDFDSLVISCSFEGSPCDRENFTVLYNPRYGKCYMFNYAGPSKTIDTPLQIFNYGSNSGLQMILHVGRHEVVDLISREMGARVVVHDPTDLPFVAEYGVNVRPDDMTAIEVTLSKNFRLGHPWGECMEHPSVLPFPYEAQRYSLLDCEKKCRNYYINSSCHCIRRQYKRGDVILSMSQHEKFCKIVDTDQMNCMNDVIKAIENNTIQCGCKPPCNEFLYATSISSSELNEEFFRTVKSIRTLKYNDGKIEYINPNDTSKAMVGLRVYYNTFQVMTDTEEAYYSWETLIANIGGNLGFFMGLSLVTFLEVAEFLWDVTVTAIATRFRRRKKVVPPRY